MSISKTSPFYLPIEKLDGRQNYKEWKFAVKVYFKHEGLWQSVLGREANAERNVDAKSQLILLIKPVNYAHIQSCETAHDIWERLSTTFDSGLSRRVSLMRILTSTKLDNSESMEHYVNSIMNTSEKLRDINCNVSEEWLGTFLLAGLPIIYQPMIKAIERSGIAITADSVKSRLLPNVRLSSQMSVDLSTFERNHSNRSPRCFACHVAANCRKKSKEIVSASTHLHNSNVSDDTDKSETTATRYCAGFLAIDTTNRHFGSDISGQINNNRNRLHHQSTSGKQNFDEHDFVYLDNVSSQENLNSNARRNSGDGGDSNWNFDSNTESNLNSVSKMLEKLHVNESGFKLNSSKEDLFSESDSESVWVFKC